MRLLSIIPNRFYGILQVYIFIYTLTCINALVEIRKCSDADFSLEKSLAIPNELLLHGYNNTKSLEFSLKTQEPKCRDLSLVQTISIPVVNGSETVFSENGYIKINKTYYSPNEYCIKSKTTEDIKVKLCNSECSELNPCIRKCCEMDEVWDMSQYKVDGVITCRPSGSNKWSPVLYKNRYSKVSQEDKLGERNPRFVSSHPKTWCNQQFSILNLRQIDQQDITPFRILESGSVLEKVSRSRWELMSNEKYCVDGAQNIPLDSGLSGTYSGLEIDTIVLDCRGFQEEIETQSIEASNVYVFAMCIAIIFLTLTISAHLMLWRKQNIHGWTLLGYVSSLLVQFAFLIFARLIEERGLSCTFVAIGTHFASLSTFAWLTTMNFDVWLTFKTMNPSPGRSSELKRFCIYALFAITVPVTIVTVALVLNHIYGEDPFSEVIVPGYGQEKCGLDRSAEFPYLFGPMTILLASNLIFFFTTLYYVYRNQKMLKSNGVKSQILHHKIRFFLMLFLVAGVTWIFEVISWATTSSPNEQTPWYWILFDLVNILQAIAIFVIFVCNPQTVSELRQELPCLSNICKLWSPEEKERPDPSRKMSRTQISTVIAGFENVELK